MKETRLPSLPKTEESRRFSAIPQIALGLEIRHNRRSETIISLSFQPVPFSAERFSALRILTVIGGIIFPGAMERLTVEAPQLARILVRSLVWIRNLLFQACSCLFVSGSESKRLIIDEKSLEQFQGLLTHES